MSRYKAAFIHLLASVAVMSLAFAMIALVWYPGKLFSAAAGFDLLKILIGVDLVLGPLIMLIIFDSKKKWIKFDITVVILCQVGFMCYGIWSIYASRPVYIAFAENRFYLVRANEIEDVDLAKVQNPQFKTLPKFGPVYVATKEPDDPKVKEDILFGGIGGMGIQNLPQYYIPFDAAREQIRSAAKSSQDFKNVTAEIRGRMQAYERSHPEHHVVFLMLINKRVPLIAVIDAQTTEVIELF